MEHSLCHRNCCRAYRDRPTVWPFRRQSCEFRKPALCHFWKHHFLCHILICSSSFCDCLVSESKRVVENSIRRSLAFIPVCHSHYGNPRSVFGSCGWRPFFCAVLPCSHAPSEKSGASSFCLGFPLAHSGKHSAASCVRRANPFVFPTLGSPFARTNMGNGAPLWRVAVCDLRHSGKTPVGLWPVQLFHSL